MAGARIVFGMKLHPNWKENLLKQKDEGYQKLLMQWVNAQNQDEKDRLKTRMDIYWIKRKKVLEASDA